MIKYWSCVFLAVGLLLFGVTCLGACVEKEHPSESKKTMQDKFVKELGLTIHCSEHDSTKCSAVTATGVPVNVKCYEGLACYFSW